MAEAEEILIPTYVYDDDVPKPGSFKISLHIPEMKTKKTFEGVKLVHKSIGTVITPSYGDKSINFVIKISKAESKTKQARHYQFVLNDLPGVIDKSECKYKVKDEYVVICLVKMAPFVAWEPFYETAKLEPQSPYN